MTDVDHDAPTIVPEPGSPAPPTPERFGGYQLREKLGEGGYGAVHRASHPLLGDVALKVLRRKSAAEVRLFDREGRLVLDHPGIPRVLDHGEVDGQPFLAMELLEGRSLSALVRDGPLTEERALALARRIAEVLAHAHARGVVHRDLKPPNVMVGPDDHVWVLDFGIAKIGTLPDATDAIVGTPAFMSPEQAAGLPAGPAADLYALGVLLHYMLSGSLPIVADTPLALLAAVVSRPPDPLARVRPGLSPAVYDLVAHLLSKEPASRPGAAEAIHAIDAIGAGLRGGGHLAPLQSVAAGRGAILLLTGTGRADALERLLTAADALGMSVRRARATPDDGAMASLLAMLGKAPPLPERPSRAQVRWAMRAAIWDAAAAGPLCLAFEDAAHVDDGTLDLLLFLAPCLEQHPVLIVIQAPAESDLPARWLSSLDASGTTRRWPSGPPDAAPVAAPPHLTTEELHSQAMEAERLWAPERAILRFRQALARTDLAPGPRLAALCELGVLLRHTGRPAEAARLLEEANRLGDSRPVGERARVRREQGIALAESGRSPEAIPVLAESAALAREARDGASEAMSLNSLGVAQWRTGDMAGAERSFRGSLAAFRGAGAAERSGPPLGNLAVLQLQRGCLEDARELQEAALALHRASGDLVNESVSLLSLGNVLAERGDRTGARVYYEQSLAIRRRLGDRTLVDRALNAVLLMMVADGEDEAALEGALELLESARQTGDEGSLAGALEHVGTIRMRQRRWDEARAAFTEALEHHLRAHRSGGGAMAQHHLAMIDHLTGRDDEALARLDDADRFVAGTPDPFVRLQLRSDRAVVRASRDPDGSAAVLAEVLVEADRLAARNLAVETRVRLGQILASRDPESARVLAREAVDAARQGRLRDLQIEALRLWELLGG